MRHLRHRILLGAIFLLAHFPVILLVVPVAVFFLGLVADPEETHAVWYGMLNMLGIFDLSALTDAEMEIAEKRHYFWFGEVVIASVWPVCLPFRWISLRAGLRLPLHSSERRSSSCRSLCSAEG